MSYYIDISSGDISCRILTYGAALAVFKKQGFDCVLGYDNIRGYKNGDCYFGAVIGRVCNRTKNGVIKVGDRQYIISKNDGKNSLHGGYKGFDKQEWNIMRVTHSSVLLGIFSKSGDQGYPANVFATAEYRICDGALHLHLHAKSDSPTPICLTGHSYFNLGGDDIREYEYMINADDYCIHDKCGISRLPTAVKGTKFDFRQYRRLEKTCDNHFIFGSRPGIAYAKGKSALLTVTTDMPGMQFYDGNAITENMCMKNGMISKKYCGFCFEPQYIPSFASNGSVLCTPSKPFDSHITYKIDLI